MAVDQNTRYELNNVVEAFTICKQLLDATDALSLSQLCRLMSCTKNKIFRLLVTLEHHGFVEKNQQNKYSIGFAAFESARKILSKMTTLENIRPYLREIAELTNESAYLAFMGNEEMLFVDFADCSHPIKVASLVGRSMALPRPAALAACAMGDIMVDAGGLDSEVTVVIAPIDCIDSTSRRGALVVVAPSSRMELMRIKTEIIPALRTVLMRHSLTSSHDSKPAPKRRRPGGLYTERAMSA